MFDISYKLKNASQSIYNSMTKDKNMTMSKYISGNQYTQYYFNIVLF